MLDMLFSAICFLITLQITDNFKCTVLLFVLYKVDTLAKSAFVRYLAQIRGVRIMLDGDVLVKGAAYLKLKECVLRAQQAARLTQVVHHMAQARALMDAAEMV